MPFPIENILNPEGESLRDVPTHAPGPKGELPLDEETLRSAPSGDLFGMTENVGMGWPPDALGGDEYLILSNQGGLRASDGAPIALGYHTGHFELERLVAEAAKEFTAHGCVPFAASCTDPCDGRTQGTPGMMDSLPYRNDASAVLRRLIRSLPTRKGVLAIATCDKGLPAMLMALASMHDLPCVALPGGVTLAPTDGEDAGVIQSIGARFAQGEATLDYARKMICRACASPGGGCQFLGTAASAQVAAEALGLALPHAALAPSGQPVWLDLARRSARALMNLSDAGITTKDILTPNALCNAMAVHTAFGGSTNMLLHLPAIAHAARIPRPSVEDWEETNRRVPRLADVLPNGPIGHPTAQVFLAGAVPEVMLRLRDLDLLSLDALTVTGRTVGENLDWWEASQCRRQLKETLRDRDGVDPADIIVDPKEVERRGMTGTAAFPRGNLAPAGSVVKAAAIDPSVIDADGVYRKTGPARVFVSEASAIQAIKQGNIEPGSVMVLCCCGPLGSGMEEIYQITAALKSLEWGKHVAVITDARFSGFSSGACIGHVGPEALAGGPIGKLIDGDVIQIQIDCRKLEGALDLVGHGEETFAPDEGARILAERPPRPDLAPRPDLPDDTRLWAALQEIGGGTWGGCVYDVELVVEALKRRPNET